MSIGNPLVDKITELREQVSAEPTKRAPQVQSALIELEAAIDENLKLHEVLTRALSEAGALRPLPATANETSGKPSDPEPPAAPLALRLRDLTARLRMLFLDNQVLLSRLEL
jgi:hypothetical protein